MTLPESVKGLFGVELNDRKFCIYYSTLVYFLFAYEAAGSAGMAIYRLLYLKVQGFKFHNFML